MNKTTTLLALAAGTTALFTACGSPASTTPVAPLAAPSPAAAPAAPSTRPAPVADSDAGIDADDQSGDGTTTAVVRDARISDGPGWVVIRTDDDGDARVLGATALAPGQPGPVTVTLNGPVPATADDDLTAVLHLDDGDGVFDEARDPAVLDVDGRDVDDRDDGRDGDDRDDGRDGDDRDDGRDGDDIEDDDFDYRVA